MAKKKTNKYSDRIEQLQKGAMKRLALFNPHDIDESEHFDLSAWQHEHSDEDMGAQDFRENLSNISKNPRRRMLNKLMGMTKYKKNPDNTVSFLLHRGVSSEEHANATANKGAVMHDTNTSWTPSWDKANRFAQGYSDKEKPNVLTAWIHENDLIHMPKMYGKLQAVSSDRMFDYEAPKPTGENRYADENEVIVQPHKSEHAPELSTWKDQEVTNPKNIDEKITSNAVNYYGDNKERRKKDARAYLERKAQQNLRQFKKSEEFYKYEDKIKAFKNAAAGLATAASIAASPAIAKQPQQPQQLQETQQIEAPQNYTQANNDHILRSIAMVETSGGKNLKHKTITDPKNLNYGTHSRSKYGLMPITIKETLRLNPDLQQKYGYLRKLNGQKFHDAYHSHPELDKTLAERHLNRLIKHFGNDPAKIGMAWLQGITGTKRMINRGDDIENHWHVKKILNAMDQLQQTPKADNILP